MQLEIRDLHRRLGLTIVFVTHDQSEALTMSDRVAVFNAGKIEQIDTPAGLYDAPRDALRRAIHRRDQSDRRRVVERLERARKPMCALTSGAQSVSAVSGTGERRGRRSIVSIAPGAGRSHRRCRGDDRNCLDDGVDGLCLPWRSPARAICSTGPIRLIAKLGATVARVGRRAPRSLRPVSARRLPVFAP